METEISLDKTPQATTSATTSTFIGGDIGLPAKTALIKLKKATSTPRELDCLRQICLQLEREMQRKGLTSFTYSDIQLAPRE